MEKKITITGGSGFIGANLTHFLTERGHKVDLLLRPEHARWRLDGLGDRVGKHICHLEDRAETTQMLKKLKPDWIFHLAAHGAYSWQKGAGEMVTTNIVATMNLVEATAACGAEALINAGSSSEYGVKTFAPKEDDWIDPNSTYAVTKACATMFCRMAAIEKDLKMTTLRLYSAYGPWENPNRLMPTLIENGLKKKWPPLVSPEISRDFVWVEDVCEAFLLAGAKEYAPGSVFNIGTGTETKMRSLIEIAGRILGVTEPPKWGTMPNRTWDATTWVADPCLAKQVLGWEGKTSLATGIEKMGTWHARQSGCK